VPVAKLTQEEKRVVHIPWSRVVLEQEEFIEAEYLPERFTLAEPTRMRLADKRALLEFWVNRQKGNAQHAFLFKAYPLAGNWIRREYALSVVTEMTGIPKPKEGKGKGRAIDTVIPVASGSKVISHSKGISPADVDLHSNVDSSWDSDSDALPASQKSNNSDWDDLRSDTESVTVGIDAPGVKNDAGTRSARRTGAKHDRTRQAVALAGHVWEAKIQSAGVAQPDAPITPRRSRHILVANAAAVKVAEGKEPLGMVPVLDEPTTPRRSGRSQTQLARLRPQVPVSGRQGRSRTPTAKRREMDDREQDGRKIKKAKGQQQSDSKIQHKKGRK
jgi:hypothetical protein